MNFLFVDRFVSHADSRMLAKMGKDRNKAERGRNDKGIAY